MSRSDEASRKKWQAILRHVERARDTARKSRRQRAELSEQALADLAHGLLIALEGRPPEAWHQTPQSAPKAGEFTRLATRDLGVAHVLGARAGLIDDRSPNKTVRNIFDVAKQTVQAWVRTEVNSPGWATSLIQQAKEMPDRADEISKLLDIRRNPVIRRMK